MSDEHQHQDEESNHSSTTHNSGATPASNQNLIVGLVLGAAILLLLVLVFNMQNSDNPKESQSDEVSELRDQLDTLKQAQLKASIQGQNYGSAGNNYGIDPQKLAEEIATEANALAGAITGFGDTIRQKDALLQSSKDTEALLNRRIQELQRQSSDLSQAAAKALTLQQELDSTRTLLNAANTQIQELRKRPDAGIVEQLQRENEEMRARLLTLTDFETENRALRDEIRALRAIVDRATLYVENVDGLPAAAQLLFRELERLEGTDPTALAGQYGLLADQLKARPLRSINFKTGSSQLTNQKVATIRNDIAASSPNSFLLVVGYASTSGNYDANRKLSADRATAVASQVNVVKGVGQEVRAVFLNETDRFSRETPEQNQICEIWEILP